MEDPAVLLLLSPTSFPASEDVSKCCGVVELVEAGSSIQIRDEESHEKFKRPCTSLELSRKTPGTKQTVL